jgi:hypothetical protein
VVRPALILAGAGRYQDPWHDHLGNARRLAELLASRGWAPLTRTDPDGALAASGLTEDFELLVVCLGEAIPDTGPAPAAAAGAGLTRWLASGRPTLAVHAAASAFPDCADWERRLGARWLPGLSYHPPGGPGRVLVNRDCALAKGLDDFDTVDEFYTNLRLAPWVEPVAFHLRDGSRQPLAWCGRHKGAPLAYCALGHSPDSYDGGGHAALMGRLIDWLGEAAGGAEQG